MTETLDDVVARALAEKAAARPQLAVPRPAPGTTGRTSSPWGRAALDGALAEVREAVVGARNDTLNVQSFKVGQALVAGGLDEDDAREALTSAGLAVGLDAHEVDKTVASGLRAGQGEPRVPAARPLAVVASTDSATEVRTQAVQAPSSWSPLDLTAVLNGTHEVQVPTILRRVDGHALLYPGRVHALYGEPESGKSFVALAAATEVLTGGGRVLFIDYESDAGTVVERLLALGASTEAIRDGLDYVRPDADPHTPAEAAQWSALLARPYALAVLDGVTEALSQSQVSSKDNDEVTGWMRRVPRAIAVRTGAAVVLVDHVVKDADGRGRFAIGAQAKLAVLDGAAYTVDVVDPLVRGKVGVLSLRVAKDRPGQVRPHAGTWRKGDRTAEAARVVLDSTVEGRVGVTVRPPTTSGDGEAGTFRPTHLMQRVSDELLTITEPPSSNKLVQLVHGNRPATLTAIELLVAEGYVARTNGPRGSNRHRLLKAYREAADPLSDRFQPGQPSEGAE